MEAPELAGATTREPACSSFLFGSAVGTFHPFLCGDRNMEDTHDIAVYLRDLLNGGDGYMLDDFLQRRNHPLGIWQERILSTSKRYSSAEYPIGISNPHAREELLSIVKELESLKSSGTS